MFHVQDSKDRLPGMLPGSLAHSNSKGTRSRRKRRQWGGEKTGHGGEVTEIAAADGLWHARLQLRNFANPGFVCELRCQQMGQFGVLVHRVALREAAPRGYVLQAEHRTPARSEGGAEPILITLASSFLKAASWRIKHFQCVASQNIERRPVPRRVRLRQRTTEALRSHTAARRGATQEARGGSAEGRPIRRHQTLRQGTLQIHRWI
mmetsp:Transcript_135956/g.339094  ORF Transcript_135956/g.339094 Transcript_135956/m.339094 type:complete len:207 (+) Transcript_135956:1086-1706(+)